MVLARSIFLISPESKASQYFYCYPNQTSRANTEIHHDNLKELNKLCQTSTVHPVLDEIFDTLQTVCIWCDYYVTIECAQSAQVLVRIIDAQ